MRCCDPSVCLSVPGSYAMVTKTLIAAGSQTVLHPYIHLFNSPFPGLPGWASTRKVKTIWILHCQMTVSGSGISLAVHKSAPSSRQITTPAPHHSVFYRPDALPAAQPTASKHWRLGLGFIQLPCLLDFHLKGKCGRLMAFCQRILQSHTSISEFWCQMYIKQPYCGHYTGHSIASTLVFGRKC